MTQKISITGQKWVLKEYFTAVRNAFEIEDWSDDGKTIIFPEHGTITVKSGVMTLTGKDVLDVVKKKHKELNEDNDSWKSLGEDDNSSD